MNHARIDPPRLVSRALAAVILGCVVLGAIVLTAAGQAARSTPDAVPSSLLTNVGQVLDLDAKDILAGNRGVDLEAVLTLPGGDPPLAMWVQDGERALFVLHTNSFTRRAGQRVRIRGTVRSEAQVRLQVVSAQVDVIGESPLPEPLRLPTLHMFQREYFGRWMEREGVVKAIERRGKACYVTLDADDAPVAILFYQIPGESRPERWLKRRVRMQGVCVAGLDAEGRVFGFEMHVPGARFVFPPQSDGANSDRPDVPAVEFGGSLAQALAAFQPLEDPPRSPANVSNTLPVLTNVQQVLALGLDGARAHPHPVRLIGVVTHPLSGVRNVYVDDGTGGILVVYSYTDTLANRHPGQVVWVDGVAGAGPIKPWIAEARLKPLGTVPLPPPQRRPVAELANGQWHGSWIEVEGVVRDLTRLTSLYLLVAGGEQHVEVVVPYNQRWLPPLDLLEARVLLRGVCEVGVDFSGRPTHARLLLNDTNSIEILRPGNTNTFVRPLVGPGDYRERRAPSEDRIKLVGTVLFHSGAGRLFCRDTAGAFQAEQLAPLVLRGTRMVGIDRPPVEHLQPGDQIELVGAPAESAFAPRFVDAEFRRIGRTATPVPVSVTVAEASSGRLDADLVTLRSRVVSRESRTASGRPQEALLLEDDGVVFEAVYESHGTNVLPDLPRNTVVQATGICTAMSQAAGHSRNFRLQLRGPSDVMTLGRAAPWQSLRPERILTISGGAVGLALAWIWILRRQVRHRTADLREANEQLRHEVVQRRAVEHNLRASEARKTAVVETALDCIISIDQHGNIIDFNPAAEKAFGYPRGEIIGREMAELIVPVEWRERHRAGLKRAVESGRDTLVGRRIEMSALRRNGEEFPVELALSRIPTDGGPIFTAHIQDISDRKRAEADMERSLAQERELNELKSRFVSMVSHEFRTPLGIIGGSAEILDAYLDRLSIDERKSNLRDIADATRHMARMMDEVLLLGRVEAGKLACRPAPLNLSVFCAKLVEEVTASTGARCRIDLKLPPRLEGAMADESLLRHILTNLLSNAVKYSSAGAAVEFSVEAAEPLAVFCIRDQGIGIPEADQRQIFQAFHRGHNVGDTPGTGLGMVIVKHCVQLHGGRVTFESREQHGTTFTVSLPLFSPPGAPAPAAKPA